MKDLKLYTDNVGNLVLRLRYENYERLLINDDVTKYLQRLSQNEIRSINKEQKEQITIDYNGARLRIYDGHSMDEHIDKLKPLLKSINSFSENKSVHKLKEKSEKKPPKVKRKNKYTDRQIIASTLVAGVIVLGTMGFLKTAASYTADADITVAATEEPTSYVTSVETTDNQLWDIVETTIAPSEEVKSPDIILDYEDRSNTQKANFARENYGDMIEKYANMYGLDANLMLGIATQERGVHSSTQDKGGATGLMQVQNSVWIGHEIDAYNFETGKYDRFKVTKEMIGDLETNIQLGCMIFQDCLGYVDYNIPMAVQCYNFGIGNMNKVINYYAKETGQTKEDVLNNQNDIGWMDYRDIISNGDPNYVNNVFSWIGNEFDISVTKKDNTIVNMSVSNNVVLDKVY